MSPQTSKWTTKEAIQYFSFLCNFSCKGSLFLLSSGTYIFFSTLLLLMYLKKPFLLALISFTRFNSEWALTLLTASCKGGDLALVNAQLLGHAQNYFSGNAGGRNLFSLALLMKKMFTLIKKYFSLGKYWRTCMWRVSSSEPQHLLNSYGLIWASVLSEIVISHGLPLGDPAVLLICWDAYHFGRTLPWPRALGVWAVICGSSLCSAWCLQLNFSLCNWYDFSKCLKFWTSLWC